MDDYGSIKATPQSPTLGLLSGGLHSFNGAMDDMGMGLLSRGLGTEAAARVLEDMSYGSPPYRGTGMATRLSPDLVSTVGAAVNLGGFMPIGAANRHAAQAIGIPMLENHSMDSVIQNLLNMMGNRNK